MLCFGGEESPFSLLSIEVSFLWESAAFSVHLTSGILQCYVIKMSIFGRACVEVSITSACSFMMGFVVCSGSSLTVVDVFPGITLELSVLLGGMGTVLMVPPVITTEVKVAAVMSGVC